MRQIKSEEPILDLRVFKLPMFSLSTVLIIILMMALFSTMILLPFFMRDDLLLSAFTAGLVLLPGGVLNGLLSPFTGKLFDKFGPRVLVIPGTIILVIVMWLFTRISLSTSVLSLTLLITILMVTLAMMMMPTQTNGLNQSGSKKYLADSADPTLAIEKSEAINAGVQHAFTIGFILAIGHLIL